MPEVLEAIFGSKFRSRVIRFFVLNPGRSISLSEVREKTLSSATETRKTVAGLVGTGLLRARKTKKGTVYRVDESFAYYPELRDLFVKSNVYPHCAEVKNFKTLPNIKLAMVGGVFLNHTKGDLDLLIVGDNLPVAQLNKLIANIEAEIGKEIRFMKLTLEEFDYRLDMTDRFLIEFFSGPQDIIVSRLPKIKRFISEIKR